MMYKALLPALVLPHYMRKILAVPHGMLLVKRGGRVTGISVDVAVGDIVSQTLLSRVRIVDYRTRRRERVEPVERGQVIYNPAGAVSMNARSYIEAQQGPATYTVLGEEDLLLIPAALGARGETYAYGQPGIGVVIIHGGARERLKTRLLLKTFKPRILRYNEEKH